MRLTFFPGEWSYIGCNLYFHFCFLFPFFRHLIILAVQYKYWHDLHLYKTIYSYFFFCIKYILPCYVFFYNNPQFIPY